jgi:hypothetical protein
MSRARARSRPARQRSRHLRNRPDLDACCSAMGTSESFTRRSRDPTPITGSRRARSHDNRKRYCARPRSVRLLEESIMPLPAPAWSSGRRHSACAPIRHRIRMGHARQDRQPDRSSGLVCSASRGRVDMDTGTRHRDGHATRRQALPVASAVRVARRDKRFPPRRRDTAGGAAAREIATPHVPP